MKLIENYLKILNENEEDKTPIENKIILFFQDNPNPKDKDVHNFADSIGIDPDEFEEKIYKLLTSLINLKHGNDPDDKFDSKELAVGIEIEKEHIDNPVISKMIAKAHLAEIPDYYTRLKKMEKEAGIKD